MSRAHIICRNCGGRGHFRDEFNVQVLYLENEGSRSVKKCMITTQMSKWASKYEEELPVEDYAEEEVSEEFAAMITVAYDTVGESFITYQSLWHWRKTLTLYIWIHAAHAI